MAKVYLIDMDGVLVGGAIRGPRAFGAENDSFRSLR